MKRQIYGRAKFELLRTRALRLAAYINLHQIESEPVFCKGLPWSFLVFDQLPCFLYDIRYPDSAGCTKNEEEPFKNGIDKRLECPFCHSFL
jgi:hypothetical protein